MSKAYVTFCINPIKRMANTPWLLAVVVLGTLLWAAICFALAEGAGFLDSLYWSSTTMTSVGYGDLSPATAGGKIMTIVFQLWSLFVLLPCAVANIIDSVRIDERKMTHAEQEWLFNEIEANARAAGRVPAPQPEDY